MKYGNIFNSHTSTNLLPSLTVKKLFKSVNIWQNCREEGGLHVDDCEQKHFPVTLMTQMRIINHSAGCAVWALKIVLSVNQKILTSPDGTFTTTIFKWSNLT